MWLCVHYVAAWCLSIDRLLVIPKDAILVLRLYEHNPGCDRFMQAITITNRHSAFLKPVSSLVRSQTRLETGERVGCEQRRSGGGDIDIL
jgi:hypothetical protein